MAPSQAKKFTPDELVAKFRIAVGWFSPEQLEELRAWLARCGFRELETLDQTAAAWLRVSAGEARDRVDEQLRELEAAGDPPGASAKHLAEFSPPPRDRRN